MKVGIIGADGQLGFDLVRSFRDHAEVIEWTFDDFDVTDREQTLRVIGDAAPHVVINTAAFHKVGECEQNPKKSFEVNAIGAFNAASAAAVIGAKIVFISTNYVFGNSKDSYVESDTPCPLNIYGASKLAGEQLTRIANSGAYYIVRTSALFGEHQGGKGYNFVTLMLNLAREGKEIRVVDDQYTAFTYTKDLAEAIRQLALGDVSPGTYHITNQGNASWYEFAKEIFEYAHVSPDLKPISSEEQHEMLVRPRSSVLRSEVLSGKGINPTRSWEEALRKYVDFLS